MFYNLLIETNSGKEHFKTALNQNEIDAVVNAFLKGEENFRVKGQVINIKNANKFIIYDILENHGANQAEMENFVDRQKILMYDRRMSEKLFASIGSNISYSFLKNQDWGSQSTGNSVKAASSIENGKIFISHSSKDKKIVEAFCTLILNNGLRMNLKKEIFCTILESSKPKSGENFKKEICNELIHAKAVIQFISKNYKSSEICLNEMGAAWVLNEKVIPICLERKKYDIGFIHIQTQQIQLCEKKQIFKFIQDHAGTILPSVNDIDWVNLTGQIDSFEKTYNLIYKKPKKNNLKEKSKYFEGIFINKFDPPKLSDQAENNDNYFNNKIPIPLNQYNIELSIKSNSNYWRSGIRFSKTSKFDEKRHGVYPLYHLYKQIENKTIGSFFYDENNGGTDLCDVGTNGGWITVKIQTKNNKTIIGIENFHDSYRTITSYKYCQILGWGDECPFEIYYKLELIKI